MVDETGGDSVTSKSFFEAILLILVGLSGSVEERRMQRQEVAELYKPHA